VTTNIRLEPDINLCTLQSRLTRSTQFWQKWIVSVVIPGLFSVLKDKL